MSRWFGTRHRFAWFGAMSWGNAPKSAGVGCAGKDGKACAEKKKRAPDLWTSNALVRQGMTIYTGNGRV